MPGFYTLETLAGTKYEVYCLFINEEKGYLFPGRHAIANIREEDLNIEGVAPGTASVMILQRRTDGSTYQAVISPLDHLSKLGITFKHNSYEEFTRPFHWRVYAPKYLYFAFMTVANYELHIKELLGFKSNNIPMTFTDCHVHQNNYFAFYSNLENNTKCEYDDRKWPLFIIESRLQESLCLEKCPL